MEDSQNYLEHRLVLFFDKAPDETQKQAIIEELLLWAHQAGGRNITLLPPKVQSWEVEVSVWLGKALCAGLLGIALRDCYEYLKRRRSSTGVLAAEDEPVNLLTDAEETPVSVQLVKASNDNADDAKVAALTNVLGVGPTPITIFALIRIEANGKLAEGHVFNFEKNFALTIKGPPEIVIPQVKDLFHD